MVFLKLLNLLFESHGVVLRLNKFFLNKCFLLLESVILGDELINLRFELSLVGLKLLSDGLLVLIGLFKVLNLFGLVMSLFDKGLDSVSLLV